MYLIFFLDCMLVKPENMACWPAHSKRHRRNRANPIASSSEKNLRIEDTETKLPTAGDTESNLGTTKIVIIIK